MTRLAYGHGLFSYLRHYLAACLIYDELLRSGRADAWPPLSVPGRPAGRLLSRQRRRGR